ncbi:MarR family transcriptional regulator [Clostridium fermenticellae]|uniref:HTH-type transcriptional regulator SarZ n=1 Tax=Clostridium fermenticellae TaxID=2068654 RepID=A0A386H6A7_9CLOT|nr:MarR family transcriptional regulator [Clostridium fermenticellae]AYD41073.1 MarR family transcriptional regulator [Clostridium fermenticellae]
METSILNSIGPQIKIANTLIEKELNNRIAEILTEYNLTGPQVALMIYIFEAKGRTVTQKELADKFVLNHSTIRSIVKRLEKMQLIDVAHLKSDKRQIVLSLSGKGYNVIKNHINQIYKVMKNVNQKIVKNMSEDDQKYFSNSLNKIIKNFNI